MEKETFVHMREALNALENDQQKERRERAREMEEVSRSQEERLPKPSS
jgi:hypothetical protein